MRTTTGVMKGLNPTVTIVSKLLLFIFIAFCIFKENRQVNIFN